MRCDLHHVIETCVPVRRGDHGISFSLLYPSFARSVQASADTWWQQRPSSADYHGVLPLQPHKRFDFRQARVLQACRSCPFERRCRTSHKRGQLHIVIEWRKFGYHAGEVVCQAQNRVAVYCQAEEVVLPMESRLFVRGLSLACISRAGGFLALL